MKKPKEEWFLTHWDHETWLDHWHGEEVIGGQKSYPCVLQGDGWVCSECDKQVPEIWNDVVLLAGCESRKPW